MKRSSGPRKTANLSESIHQQLNMYALAAGAAGVGVLALAQPAEAKIIYTPAHKNIGAKTFLDLNHDGIHDFKFIASRTSHCVGGCTTTGVRHGTAFTSSNAKLAVYGVRSRNQIYGQAKYASALPAGVRIGPNGKFPGGNIMAEANAIDGANEYYKGPWAGTLGGGDVTHRYLGLRFTIKGKIHFGWARLNVIMSQGAHIQATLTGYAFETIAGKSIKAGQTIGTAGDPTHEDFVPDASLTSPIPDTPHPASLGMLALGAQSVPLWRRKESALEGE
jgi:hypothetical protein